jgi:hypothetical protein
MEILTLRSLVNIAHATKVFRAKTQAIRRILFSRLEKRTERSVSGNDKGLSLCI